MLPCKMALGKKRSHIEKMPFQTWLIREDSYQPVYLCSCTGYTESRVGLQLELEYSRLGQAFLIFQSKFQTPGPFKGYKMYGKD